MPRADRREVLSKMPSFGSRLTQAMTYRRMDHAELTSRLRAFGLQTANNYVYRLTSTSTPPNPTLLTLAGLREALQVDSEWWFDPGLTAADLPRLDLQARKRPPAR